MADEDKAEEYADKMLSDSKYPFIFSKEKVKEYIIKVYLDSLKCCENAYNKGFAEGRKQGFDEGYKKATERAYERQQDLTNTYIKDGEKIKQLAKENAEVKILCKELIKINNELRNSLRKYEIVPNVDYLPNGSEVYKENVGNNPYGVK